MVKTDFYKHALNKVVEPIALLRMIVACHQQFKIRIFFIIFFFFEDITF